ncbi:MAG TPA: flavodoxin domain-containing protein [Candidatus Acidoferrum sp.]|nr:flavodoxin domain-containing protein [Candidatus Acidoferrum sp.]
MEKNIGIYYVSKHGQTDKIAHFLGECFAGRGWEVYVTNLRNHEAGTPDVSNFSAVLIGAPMYMQHYPRAVREFVSRNRRELMAIPSTGFFSTCLTATRGTREAYLESLEPVRNFLDEVAWTPDWIVSFPGALNYREYDPLTRWVMKRVAQKEGGPTDTSKDYELTRWEEVSRFAQDFDEDTLQSPYRAETISLATRTLNELMPELEQRLVQEITIPASPEEVRSAIESMELADMPLADLLAWIRNLGRASEEHPVTFQQAATTFGALPIVSKQPHEIAGGLVGQFWKRNYGIRMMRNLEEFKAFDDPAFTKTLTNFWFDDYHDGKTLVRTETRIHSLGPKSRRRFHGYWSIVSVGVRLYMGSALRGIARSVFRRHREHHVLAA